MTKLLHSACLLICISGAIGLAAAAAGHPGCMTRSCGDVDIPFPFGIGDHCAIHEGFQLECHNATEGTSKPKPFLGNFEVTKISMEDGKVWVKAYMSTQCYDQSTGGMSYNDASMNLSGSSFWLSNTDNRLIIIGCQTLAYVTTNSMQQMQYVIGCSSACDINRTPKNGSCSGAGCCQANVPEGIQYYQCYFNEGYNTTLTWMTSPCNYMAVMETTAFNFSTSYLTSTVFYDTYKGGVPVVVDWAITSKTCTEAKRNKTSYACVSNNSHCFDMNAHGHRCKCSNGYEGNPYVKDGCKDIDECLNNVTYPCVGICTNTLGSFSCSCYPGSYMTNGVCVPNRKLGSVSLQVGLVVVLGVLSGICLLSLVFGIVNIKQHLKKQRAKALRAKFFDQNRGFLLQQLVDKDIAEKMIFSLEELEKATNQFDDTRRLGGGGHGTVYKGILSDQHVVAIKKSKNTVKREINDFVNEVAILSQINHRNVVRLFGCCLEAEVPLLVYEFIPNGTLSNHLHVEGIQSLSWKNRLRIALETASALSYLHYSASIAIIHRDVKPDNILLNDLLTAKVSDFGASRGIPIDQAGVTTVVQGTFGYLDPEYYQTGRLTEKSDVYSFGVILVELLTRKRPSSFMSSERVSLIAHFNLLMCEDKLSEILDTQVILEGAEDVDLVAALAGECLRLNGQARPTMKNVEMRLQRLSGEDSNTVQGSKIDLYHDVSAQMSISKGSSSSKQCSIEEDALLSASFPR